MQLSTTLPPKEKELTIEDIKKAIPAYLFKKDESRFLISVGFSVSLTLITGFLAYKFIPLNIYMLPLWILYAFVNGTIATGVWVLGHECGHGSFSESQIANDILGYILHTPLLVPYFSWQHSHHVHHSRTNHVDEGETHVPVKAETKGGKIYLKLKDAIGEDAFALYTMFTVLILGWPFYLVGGFTGGPARGFTSHFIVPNQLFPKKLLPKVIITNIGLIAVVYGLYLWAQATSFALVAALYLGPYLVVNMWLTGYTLLQHTDENVPHYDASAWNWLKGALATIDRSYPAFINALHFDIGSTHVLHHIFSYLPHYNAPIANEYLKQVLGDKYLFDKQNVWKSFYETCKISIVENTGNGEWRYITKFPYFTKAKKA